MRKVNIFNSSLSESWGLQWFNRCEQSVPGIQIWWSMLLSTTRSYGIGFSQRYSIFFSNRLFLYLHKLVYLTFCDAESFCPRFWHFPCDRHFPSTGALAQSLLGIKWINRIYSLLLFRFSPSQILSTLLSLFFLRCSSTSSEEQLQSSSMTKR